jgi:predicted dithiol-disulfide oxidoreductase (DUF899 family)
MERCTMQDDVPERGLVGRAWTGPDADRYRERRAALLVAETALRDQGEAVAALRRGLPPGPLMPGYAMMEGPADLSVDGWPEPVDLIDLFAPERDVLVVYHLMFWPSGGCPMCSMWLDGLNGVAAHLAQHVSLAVTAPAPLPRLRAWGRNRGWDRLRLVSSAGTTLGRDLGFDHRDDAGDGGQMPGVSVFSRAPEPGRVSLFWHGQPELVDGGRGIDALSPVWNVLDLTPGGRPEWWPGNDYPLTWTAAGSRGAPA